MRINTLTVKEFRALANKHCGAKDKENALCNHRCRAGKYCIQFGCPERDTMEKAVTEKDHHRHRWVKVGFRNDTHQKYRCKDCNAPREVKRGI